jgi:hypothetical protein
LDNFLTERGDQANLASELDRALQTTKSDLVVRYCGFYQFDEEKKKGFMGIFTSDMDSLALGNVYLFNP